MAFAGGRWRGNGARGCEFDYEAGDETLVRDLRALDSIEPVASVGVFVAVVGVKDDVAFESSAQGVGLDSPCRTQIVEVDTQPVGSGETDDAASRISRLSIMCGLFGPPRRHLEAPLGNSARTG